MELSLVNGRMELILPCFEKVHVLVRLVRQKTKEDSESEVSFL